MENKAGRYPFETYGLLMADVSTGFELETQTLSLFERELFTDPAHPAWYIESIMVHELAHQWFGNSVSPRTWSDLSVNEGHATWYEALYAQEKAGRSLEARMKAAYEASDRWRAEGGPPPLPRPRSPARRSASSGRSCTTGPRFVLYALREEIGRTAFDRLERRWVTQYRDGTASTADFVRLASDTAGRDLTGFLNAWLHGAKTPPMPGHPDWKTTDRAPEKSTAYRFTGHRPTAPNPRHSPLNVPVRPCIDRARAGNKHGDDVRSVPPSSGRHRTGHGNLPGGPCVVKGDGRSPSPLRPPIDVST
ncbi:hypothetical protein SHIRM173S_10183 [Streptomyces hirsutus]